MYLTHTLCNRTHYFLQYSTYLVSYINESPHNLNVSLQGTKLISAFMFSFLSSEQINLVTYSIKCSIIRFFFTDSKYKGDP